MEMLIDAGLMLWTAYLTWRIHRKPLSNAPADTPAVMDPIPDAPSPPMLDVVAAIRPGRERLRARLQEHRNRARK